jgi:hypothetical protein
MKKRLGYLTAIIGFTAMSGCSDGSGGTGDSKPEAKENSADLCGDGEDNDGDGALDCDDAECLATAACVDSESGDSDALEQTIEEPGSDCKVPATDVTTVEFDALPEIEEMPDPFTMIDGTKVTSRSQWVCRRAEISHLLQKWELGDKPDKPASVTGSMSDNVLTVTVSDGKDNELSFTASITYPTSGSGPYPAVIALAGGSLPADAILDLKAAIINFDNDSMGDQGGFSGKGVRGNGQFFDFNGKVDAGALLAWSWGVSRLIDALEVTPEADIDPTRLAVTGCSRNGKGALMIGALDNRIALTIPQESGSGGVASWRVSEEDDAGENKIQTLKSASTEQPWFRKTLVQFGSHVNKVPIDHHEVMGMVAPRGLLVLGNVEMEWLGRNSCDQSAAAARLIFEALGAKENIGHTESSHDHCVFPTDDIPVLEAFIKKFLFHEDMNTDVWTVTSDFDTEKWADWTVPDLTK